MDLRLRRRTAVVLGASRGLGRAIASLDAKAAERQGISVEEVERNSRTLIPAGRYGDPGEFGDTAAFLLSERGSYITGSVIRVDGGLIKSI